MNTGTTLTTNSSIACSSRKEAIRSPPPINQMFFPGCPRRRLTNGPIASFTNSTRDFGRWRLTGEDDGAAGGVEACSHPEACLVGLPANYHRVDRLHEGIHAIEPFGGRA